MLMCAPWEDAGSLQSSFAVEWRARLGALRRHHNRLRWARLASVPRERFTLADVIARDGLWCALCGTEVVLGVLGAMEATVDHVVPVSGGGPDTLANAQLAHRGCNCRKKDRF